MILMLYKTKSEFFHPCDSAYFHSVKNEMYLFNLDSPSSQFHLLLHDISVPKRKQSSDVSTQAWKTFNDSLHILEIKIL